jgi:hypothetical protein
LTKSVKKIFCFVGDTMVEMADGSIKRIKDLTLGDKTRGGRVESIRIAEAPDGAMYEFDGIRVTGFHAVKSYGHWVRIRDTLLSRPVPGGFIVHSIVTSNHRVWVNGIEFADEHETDNYEHLDLDESLQALNATEVACNGK